MPAQLMKWAKGAHPKKNDQQNANNDQSADQDFLFRVHLLLPLQFKIANRDRIAFLNAGFFEGIIHA